MYLCFFFLPSMHKDLTSGPALSPSWHVYFLFARGFLALCKSAIFFPSVSQVLANEREERISVVEFHLRPYPWWCRSDALTVSFLSQKGLGLSVKQNTKSVFILRTVWRWLSSVSSESSLMGSYEMNWRWWGQWIAWKRHNPSLSEQGPTSQESIPQRASTGPFTGNLSRELNSSLDPKQWLVSPDQGWGPLAVRSSE